MTGKSLVYIFILTGSCFAGMDASAQTSSQKLFSLVPSSQTGVYFSNDILENSQMFYYLYEYLYNGAGVAVGDINNDGLQDLYFSSTPGSNKLYLNLGDFRFLDITASAGVGGGDGMKTGVNMIDINNDGWLDILVCKSGPTSADARKKLLYINNGNGTFTDRAKEFGLDEASYTTQAYFLDYDNDGDMDVYFANHPVDFTKAMLIPIKVVNGKQVYAEDTATQYVSDRLFQNNNGRFSDVTKKAGLINHAFALSAAIYDFNNDGRQDIYVANDFNKPDFLYINNGNGTFTDKFRNYFSHTSFSSMGSDMNDLDNDGLEDLFVLDMAIEDPVRQKQLFVQNMNYDKFELLIRFNLFYQYPRNSFQLNNGNGTFSETGYYSGIAQTDWSWAPLIADWDNDGWKDIYITNGLKRDITDWDYKTYVLDSIKNLMQKGISVDLNEWFKLIPSVKIKNYFYRNNQTLRFENFSDKWCDQPPSFSNGAVYADLDNDGDLDIVVSNIDDPAFIYRNNAMESGKSDFYRFRFLKDRSGNKEVYGGMVRLLDANGNIQVQHYDPQRGYMSTVEHFLHFGSAKETKVEKAEITFPGGKKIVLNNPAPDQVFIVYESDARIPENKQERTGTVLFKNISSQNKFRYTHVENDFIDFKREPLIPYKCSRKGPYYTMADVNGDQLPDIFIGGAAGSEAKLMIQNTGGAFIEKKQLTFTTDKKYEDAGVLFFDADGDGDNDLYVVSGGAEFDEGSPLYQDRLYINDAKGNFTKSVNAVPAETFNGSVVIALDYDEDGDMDLFIGGQVLPGKFPMTDKSVLLRNDKGIFRNVTAAVAPELEKAGIINSVEWKDLDGDGRNELIIAGEWMPVMIFASRYGKFNRVSASLQLKDQQKISLDELTGWWNIIKAADIDNDGDLDLVAGNRGLNSKITASLTDPCTAYASDFDYNGSYDAVLGYYIEGKCYPMYHRDQLFDQIPMMRKRFLRYKDYAGKTMDEIFTEGEKQKMDIYTTACFESGIFYNDGDFNFRFEPLPERAQLSTINDIAVDDFDKDGVKDILVCGNSYDPDVSTGNYDAVPALLLKGNQERRFTAVPAMTSGFSLTGEVRRIIYQKESGSVIFLRNSDPATVFSIK